MSLLEQIKNDQLTARKAKDSIKASLLTTLFSEASMKGKNAGRETTDEEVVQVIQKFLKGVNETLKALEYSSDGRVKAACIEKDILESYLPKMASAEEIRAAVAEIAASGVDPKTKMGIVMKMLKDKFGASLDGKLASQIAKE